MKNETFESFLIGLYPQKTIQSYAYSVSKFKSEHPKADSYSYQAIVDYFFDLKKKRLSNAYRTKILSALKKYYEYLNLYGFRDDHPCRRFQLNSERLKGVHFEDLFTPDELLLLMEREERYAILELRNKVIISILIYQGLTSEELIRISLPDIDLDSGTVFIRSTKKLNSRKLELHRTQIMLYAKYINDVRPLLIQKETNSYFILNKFGRPETTDNIHSLLHSMKLIFPTKNLNPQQIRISVIANWLNIQKIPLADVQLLAGHKWPSTTEKYLRSDLEAKRELINRFHPLEQLQIKADFV